MAIIEKFAKKEREANQAGETPEREIKGPSVKEILANKDQSDLFGEYLSQEGDEELGAKIMSGNLDRGDFEVLAEKRKGFLEVMERSKNIGESLDIKTIKELADSSPELKIVLENVGPEGVRSALKRFLPRIAITDRERFSSLDFHVTFLKETKKAIDEEEKELKKLRNKYEISEEEFIDLLQGGDAEEIAKDVHDKLGFWKRKFTRVKTIREEIESLAGAKADKIRDYLAQREGDIKELGGVLEATLMDNPILHETIVADLKKDEAPKMEAGASFSEVRGPKEEDIKKAWDDFSGEYEKKYGFRPENSPNSHYEEAAEEFSREYLSKNAKGKKGFWARISEAFWSSAVDNFLKKQQTS